MRKSEESTDQLSNKRWYKDKRNAGYEKSVDQLVCQVCREVWDNMICSMTKKQCDIFSIYHPNHTWDMCESNIEYYLTVRDKYHNQRMSRIETQAPTIKQLDQNQFNEWHTSGSSCPLNLQSPSATTIAFSDMQNILPMHK